MKILVGLLMLLGAVFIYLAINEVEYRKKIRKMEEARRRLP